MIDAVRADGRTFRRPVCPKLHPKKKGGEKAVSSEAQSTPAAQPAQLKVHFILVDGSHQMDAQVLHECQGEVLALIREVGKHLDIAVSLEAVAYGEGGVEVFLNLVGRHAVALSLLGAAVTAIISAGVWMKYQSTLLQQQISQNDFALNRDKKLAEQQIEQNEINLKKARIELKKLAQESSPDAQKAPATGATKSLPLEPPPSAADVVPALLSKPRVVKLRSQFYEQLLSYEKVSAVGFSPRHRSTEPEIVVPRAEFSRYVVMPHELQPTLIRGAEIEIVAPVLKRGGFKWRGLFEKRGINFDLLDEDFLTKVLAKKVKFQNGTTLICDLEIHLRDNAAGAIEPYGYVVRRVEKHYHKNVSVLDRSAIHKEDALELMEPQKPSEMLPEPLPAQRRLLLRTDGGTEIEE